FAVRAVDAAGNADLTPESTLWTVDTQAPTVSGVSLSGPGIVRGSGTLTVGQSVIISVALSEPVTLTDAGGLRLQLSDGGVAAYDAAASDASHLVFTHTVVVDAVSADLAITGLTLGSATILDAAGNVASLAGAATNPAGALRIDGYTGTAAAETFHGTPGAETFKGQGGNDTYL
ncbi:hypothetical protein, partial [Methylobacterium sp. Leaf108]